MNNKVFELPYNFNDNYIDKLSLVSEYFKYIKFIYLPAFKEDNIHNSREYDNLLNDSKYKNYNIYCNVINKLLSFNIDIAILMQNGATIELIDKYVNKFNIKYFIINDDKLALQIKQKYNDKVYLILSITRLLTYNDILTKDLSMYDEIVLQFWFNRHLSDIKRLPKKYKYSILVNSNCNCYCKIPYRHWFKDIHVTCKYSKYEYITIYPNDIYYFKDYINSFKIVDRTSETNKILDALKEYVNAYKNINIKNTFKDENYYNLKD